MNTDPKVKPFETFSEAEARMGITKEIGNCNANNRHYLHSKFFERDLSIAEQRRRYDLN